MKIAVAGTGYVGLSMAVLLSQRHQVTAVDIIPEKVEMINQRESPIRDEYIEQYFAEKELIQGVVYGHIRALLRAEGAQTPPLAEQLPAAFLPFQPIFQPAGSPVGFAHAEAHPPGRFLRLAVQRAEACGRRTVQLRLQGGQAPQGPGSVLRPHGLTCRGSSSPSGPGD